MDISKLIDKLSEEQQRNAILVAQEAIKQGVNPSFAIAIAFQEGSLNLNAKRGGSGEIGMMQVMPKTGLEMGFNEKDLEDPAKNIAAGIQYLKRGLEATGGDSKLAAAFYNGGMGAINALTKGDSPDPRVINYIRKLSDTGIFDQPDQPQQSDQQQTGQQADQQAAPSEPIVRDLTPEEWEIKAQEARDEQERRQAQIYGGVAGAGTSAAMGLKSGVGSIAEEIGKRYRGAPAGAPPAGTPASPQVPSVVRQGPVSGQAAPGPRMPPPIPGLVLTGDINKPYAGHGSAAANYGWKFNLPDIELGRVASMGSDEGGAQKFIKDYAEGMKRARSAASGSILAQQPSGLLETISTGGRPRESFTQLGPMPTDPGHPRQLFPNMSQPGALERRPTREPQRVPTSTAPKGPSGLEQVTQKFTNMMGSAGSGLSTLGKYAAPPLTMASAAGEAANIKQQLSLPSAAPLDVLDYTRTAKLPERDNTSMGLSALNILGSGLSFVPKISPYGMALSLGTAAAQEYRRNPKIREAIQRRFEEAGQAPYSDPMTGFGP